MSKERFAEYVSSQAFVLTLSRPMIDALVYLYLQEIEPKSPFPNVSMSGWSGLERRGLMERSWTHGPNGGRKFRAHITMIGKMVYHLLDEAGLVTWEHHAKAAGYGIEK